MGFSTENIKKKALTLSTGIGAAGITIGSSLTGHASALCTGACGSCGFGCGSLISAAGVGAIALISGRKNKKPY